MAYDLEQFSSDVTAILKRRAIDGLDDIALKLQQLLHNPDFVSRTFTDETPFGKRELFHDPETNVYVLAHVQKPGKRGNPHSHGDSWAIYGNARGLTQMTNWRRVNAETEEHAVLEPADSYTLGPGQARAYGPHVIHSTQHPEKAWVIRVTGCDLDVIPRYRFRAATDSIVEQAHAQ